MVNKKTYITFALIGFCVLTLYYFYKSLSETASKPVESTTEKSATQPQPSLVSKKAFQQANRTPLQQEENPPKPIDLEGLDQLPTVEDYFNSQYPDNRWRILRNEAGQVTSIVPEDGGSISPQQYGGQLLNWAKQIAPLFGAKSDQLNSSIINSETNFQVAYHFQQTVEGFEVFRGGLQVFTRQRDQAIFSLNNSLREIPSFEKDVKITREKAWEYLKEQFEAPIELIDGPDANPTERQIYTEDPCKNELVWIFDLRVNVPDPYTTKRVLVSSLFEKNTPCYTETTSVN